MDRALCWVCGSLGDVPVGMAPCRALKLDCPHRWKEVSWPELSSTLHHHFFSGYNGEDGLQHSISDLAGPVGSPADTGHSGDGQAVGSAHPAPPTEWDA